MYWQLPLFYCNWLKLFFFIFNAATSETESTPFCRISIDLMFTLYPLGLLLKLHQLSAVLTQYVYWPTIIFSYTNVWSKLAKGKPRAAIIKNNPFKIHIEIYNMLEISLRSKGAGNQNAKSIIIFDWRKKRPSFFKR